MKIVSWDPGQKNLAYCILDSSINPFVICGLKCETLAGTADADVRSFIEVRPFLTEGIDLCVIEEQPHKRKDMTRIMYSIFFIYKYVFGIEARLIKANHRYKIFGSVIIPKGKKKYRERKKISATGAARIMESRPNCPGTAAFVQNKKKDDLADCYLQALYCAGIYFENILL